MKRLVVLVLFSSLARKSGAETNAKIPAHCLGRSNFISLPNTCTDAAGNKVDTGLQSQAAYLRVHPSGKYAIVTSTSLQKAVVLDLTKWRREWDKRKTAKHGPLPEIPCIVTPLSAEAYPLEPNWELVSSNDQKAMKYYRFEDLLKQKDQAQPILADSEHNQFYQSHAVVTRNAQRVEFKTMLYTELSSRTYRLKYNDKGQLEAPESDAKGPIIDLNATKRFDGVSTPILSKDGQFLSMNTQAPDGTGGTQKIFSLARPEYPVLVADIGYATGKPSFAYPETGKGPIVAYSDLSLNIAATPKHGEFMPQMVEVFNSSTKTKQLSSFPWLEQDAAYPNFTRDKHLVYVAKRGGKMGLVETIPADYPKTSSDRNGNSYADCFEYFDKNNFVSEETPHARYRSLYEPGARKSHAYIQELLRRYSRDSYRDSTAPELGSHGESISVTETQKRRLIEELMHEQGRLREKIRRLPTREEVNRLQERLDRLDATNPPTPPSP